MCVMYPDANRSTLAQPIVWQVPFVYHLPNEIGPYDILYSSHGMGHTWYDAAFEPMYNLAL